MMYPFKKNMDNQKVSIAVIETVGVSLTPYLLYIEHVTPVFTFISAIVGTVYITIKAVREIKNK
jgi:energy-converting hydrogenase Eha subunit E